jgi:hypothetical protein
MTVYRVDVQIAGTAYIKAENEEQALEKAKELNDATIEVPLLGGQDVPAADVTISGRRFEDPKLPEVSLSPMLTVHGVWPGAEVEEV